jgi:CubicO group peptidase (beta-lactamase class C family)
MKKGLLLIALCAFAAIGARRPSPNLPPPLASSRQATAHQNSASVANLNARIARIESGLLPAVTIKGQPVPTMTIADRMAHYKVPGVSVAFFDRGEIVWTRTYGFADVASKKPITTETRFQAASISKPVAALAALRLVQDGKLNLDENVNDKLRGWAVPENEFTKVQKVTLRRILSHSAGLTVHGFPGYAAGEPVPTIVQILNGEKPANTDPIRVDVVPGTLWRYSGGGFVIMQLLLTEIMDEPFPRILHDFVLQPAGMKSSTYEQPLPKELSALAATPYRANGEPVKGGWHTYPEMAPAGLWTTPSDLARLAIEVQSEYAGNSSKILSQAMIRQMLSHQKDDWGLGFALESPSGALRFGHGGANEGYRCQLEAYIESGQGIAIMTNSDNGGSIDDEYISAVAKEYNWPDFHPVERSLAKVDPALFAAYTGTYEGPDIGKETVSVNGGKLYIQADPLGPEPQQLLPESDSVFFILSRDVTFVFQKDDNGNVAKLILHAGKDLTLETKRVAK